MPAATTIVINDGAATPVAHTFTPIGKDSKGVMWFEQTTPTPTSPMAAKRIGYKQTRGDPMAKRADQAGKVVYTIHLPTPETLGTNDSGLTPPATLAYKQVARVEFDLPERGTVQERKDVRVLLGNLLNTGSVGPTNVDNLQPIYGG
jgi:hypothetical protein